MACIGLKWAVAASVRVCACVCVCVCVWRGGSGAASYDEVRLLRGLEAVVDRGVPQRDERRRFLRMRAARQKKGGGGKGAR